MNVSYNAILRKFLTNLNQCIYFFYTLTSLLFLNQVIKYYQEQRYGSFYLFSYVTVAFIFGLCLKRLEKP